MLPNSKATTAAVEPAADAGKELLQCCACGIVLIGFSDFFLRFASIKQNLLCATCTESHIAEVQLRIKSEDVVKQPDPNKEDGQISGGLVEEYIAYDELGSDSAEIENLTNKPSHPVFTCRKCGKTCNTPVHLQVHEYMRHRDDYRQQRIENNEFYCQICDTSYPNMQRLEYHFNHKHGKGKGNKSGIVAERPIHGVAGLRYMRSLEDLKAWTNKTNQSDESKNHCTICNISYKLNYLYEHHMTSHAAEDRVVAELTVTPCEVTAKDDDAANDITMFECVVCGKKYGSINKLLSHGYFQHNPVKRGQHKPYARFHSPSAYPCKVCGRNYKSAANLNAHKHYMHRDPTTRYPCRVCPERFDSLLGRREHENDSHRDTATLWYQCSHCDRQCRKIAEMEVHVASTHSAHKRVACDQCGKSFTNKRYLKQHMRCHSETRSHECEFCDKSFKFADQLSRHLTRHKAARSVSGKQFQDIKDLHRHALTNGPTVEKTAMRRVSHPV